jgi:hypothetical protein
VIDSRKPPLTFAAVAPVVAGSRIANFLGRALDFVARAAAEARISALAARVARVQQNEPAAAVAAGAWVIAMGALTHIAMLLVVERYQFPSRAALVMPAIIAAVALAAIPLSAHIARAMTDRRHQ